MSTGHLPAFPTGTWDMDGQGNYIPYQEEGMTLRDYFAVHAPADVIDSISGTTIGEAAQFICVAVEEYHYSKHSHLVDTKARYIYADAMMRARERVSNE